jgi:aminoglycoside phosphotransferase (APT) family kinase protein
MTGRGPGDDESGHLRALSTLVGTTVVAVEPARWGHSDRTDLATAADGSRYAVQRLVSGPSARHRIHLARSLPPRLARAGIPAARLLAADPDARPPFLVTSLVQGRTGAELLDDAVDAIALATEMGRLVRRLSDVPIADLRLPSTWRDPQRLGSVAARWLRRSTALLDRPTEASLAAVIARLPALFAGRPAVLAHGDWAPVNVIVERRAVVAVLDWEFARLADPLFDVAWWGWIVSYHHPDVYLHAWPAFLETAGITLDPLTLERIHAIESLRLLEALAAPAPMSGATDRAAWAHRIRARVLPDERMRPGWARYHFDMPDLIVVLVVGLIVVLVWRGPKTLPKLGEALGRGVKAARDEAKTIEPPDDTPPTT